MSDSGITTPDPSQPAASPPLPPPLPPQAMPQQFGAAPYPYAPVPGAGPRPGRTLGIVGFIFSFFFVLDIIGLILSIMGVVKSRRAGNGNGLAVAGIIISLVGIALTAVLVATLVGAAQECGRLGPGVHHVGNSVYTCTSTSFNVSTG
jgi:hypothetical protein